MATELAKQYDPKEAQQRWLHFWNENKFFHSDPDANRKPFTIVIPPPNVTGALHMGHALNNTLQDVLIRWRRMQGYNALWMPGTDHAGIATQAMVERRLAEDEKKTRHDVDRDELVRRIWQWKDQYEKRIIGQLRELGCSCDWERLRFTLDPMCARAVRQTFFQMFKDGLIFRGKRLVNWDTHLQTSVADDETYTEDTKSGFWTFKYQVRGGPGASATGEFIRFSTTRPETMLGDTAVCVHPSDERYKHLIGKTVTIPLVHREIPIIADGLLADPTLGTGCVKVTPAHDPNDYACSQRNPQIGIINILNPDGTINENGGKYKGLDRYKAREAVVADMEALGLFEGKEERIIPLKYSDRSKTPIEPYLSDQWFVKMGDLPAAGGEAPNATPPAANGGLARMAMEAVENGQVKFFPERYKNSYLDWLAEKRDWCISRQLWWGHRIPVWVMMDAAKGSLDEIKARLGRLKELRTKYAQVLVVNTAETEAAKAVGPHGQELTPFRFLACVAPGAEDVERELEAIGFVQDPDVLDTWFSSMLWPHSTLGWPEKTSELAYYYPTNVLVTSRDIITLWVARMVIAGLYNVGKVPFHHVYIHSKILDGFGEGMSKSKGNGIDPLDIIDRYGTDALRFIMVHLSTETQDSKMPVANVCPHCDTLVPVKQEHLSMRTRKVTCPNCKKPFRPGGPWPAADPELPTAKQASDRFDQGRNFANKLWNAARFLLLNLEGYRPGAIRPEELPIEDRWILSRLATTTAAVTEMLEGYKFSEAIRHIYEFTWSEFCDWYVEMSKGRLRDEAGRGTVQRVLVGVLDAILRLVQPVMPFVAESIWQTLNEVAPERSLPLAGIAERSVVIAAWPSFPAAWIDAATEARIARMQELVRNVREVRNRYMVDVKTPLNVSVRCSVSAADDFRALQPFIASLAGVGALHCGPDTTKPRQSATIVHPEFEAYVSLAGLIDPTAEVKRLEKQLAEKVKHLQGTRAKLSNASFVDKAPADVVQQQRDFVVELQNQIQTIESNLKELRHAAQE